MSRSHTILQAMVLTITSLSMGQAKPTYPVVLHRPLSVDKEYSLEMISEHTRTLTNLSNPSEKPQTDSVKCVLAGNMKVLETNKLGNAKGMVITIKEFKDASGNELLPSGTKLTIRRGEKVNIYELAAGRPPAAEATTALNLTFTPLPEPAVSDDESFGSKTPKAVGETWAMNPDPLCKIWMAWGWSINPATMTGSATLESIDRVSGTEVLHITSIIGLKNATPPGLPPGMNILDSEFHWLNKAVVPVNTATEMQVRDMSHDGVIQFRDPSTHDKMQMKVHSSQKESILPLNS